MTHISNTMNNTYMMNNSYVILKLYFIDHQFNDILLIFVGSFSVICSMHRKEFNFII